MKFFSFRFLRRPFFQKKKSGSYALLLRKKREKKQIRGKAGGRKNPFLFFFRKYWNVAVGIGVGVIVFLILGGVFFFSHLFVIREISLTRKDLRVNVSGVSALLMPLQGENIFLISGQEVRNLLQQNFPEIQSVEVHKNFPGSMEVVVETFPIVAKWEFQKKGENEEEAETSKTVFINILGQVSPGEPTDEETAFPIIEKLPALPPDIQAGVSIYPANHVQEILETKDLLESETPFTIIGAEVLRDAQEVHFISSDGVRFWFDFFSPFSEQMQKIEIAEQEIPLFEKNLLYLDLRIPGKLIYREQ